MRNKSGLKRYIAIITLYALLSTVLMTGCSPKYHSGDTGHQSFIMSDIFSAVYSDTDTFDKNEVTLEFRYGFYDIDYVKKYNSYGYRQYSDDKVIFAVYITDYEHCYDFSGLDEFADYKNIEHYHFIEEITEDEALSDYNYGYTMGWIKGVKYNHTEKLTIPSELFDEEKSTLVIVVASFIYPNENHKEYFPFEYSTLEIPYVHVDENNIKIKF